MEKDKQEIEPTETIEGAFVESLKRSNREIKSERAESIVEDARMTYKRTVEDLELDIRKLRRKRANMLDLSPTHANTLKLAEDFDAIEYTEQDIKIGVELRLLEVKYEIAKERYAYLFGGE